MRKPPQQLHKEYHPRSAGPPVGFADMLAWTLISFAAYLCFILLPGRISAARRQRGAPGAPVAMSSWNDLIMVANHLYFCLWIWPVHDYACRFFRLILLHPTKMKHLWNDKFFDPAHQHWFAEIVRAVRATLGTNEAEVSLEFSHRYATVAATACLVAAWFALVVQWARKFGGRGRGEQLVPTVAWMVLWSLGFSTSFAWVNGTPILVGQLYPGCICLLIVYTMLVP